MLPKLTHKAPPVHSPSSLLYPRYLFAAVYSRIDLSSDIDTAVGVVAKAKGRFPHGGHSGHSGSGGHFHHSFAWGSINVADPTDKEWRHNIAAAATHDTAARLSLALAQLCEVLRPAAAAVVPGGMPGAEIPGAGGGAAAAGSGGGGGGGGSGGGVGLPWLPVVGPLPWTRIPSEPTIAHIFESTWATFGTGAFGTGAFGTGATSVSHGANSRRPDHVDHPMAMR